MKANNYLKINQYTNIVAIFSKLSGISLDYALDFFYHSHTYHKLDKEIGDYHCEADLFIAQDLFIEYTKKPKK